MNPPKGYGMIDLTGKTEEQLRALISFYQRRDDRAAVRMIENEIRRSADRPSQQTQDKIESTPSATATVPLDGKPDPQDCVHDWIPMDDTRIVDRFRCRICGTIGWRDGLYDGRARVYTCQHQGCRRPVQGVNAVGGRYCQEHYFDKPLKPRGL